jgi:glutamyl endopeptidase
MTVPDIRAMLKLKSVDAPVGKESIIGPDTRIRTYTTYYPARAVALITFSGGRCTGWFIGPNTIATAGHCVHSGGANGSWYSSYKIYPGYDQTTAPYGSCTAKSLSSVTGWTQSGSESYDYGAIKLNCTVGNTVGWFGLLSTPNSLTNYPAIISGYPGDKPLQQWWSSDTVRVTETYQLFYPNDTIGGMSGSPVWYDRNGPYAMAIHAYGLHGSSPHSAYNHGTRITQAVYNNLVAWKNAP